MMKSSQIKNSDIKKVQEYFTSGVMPVTAYDPNSKCFILASGLFMDFLEIVPKDLNTADDDMKDFDNALFLRMLNTYKGDLKIVAFNFPVNTQAQRRYFENRIRKTDHPVRLELLNRRLAEEEVISGSFQDRQYALMYYGESVDEIKKNAMLIAANLNRGGQLPIIKPMDREKKFQLLFRLFNKNTKIPFPVYDGENMPDETENFPAKENKRFTALAAKLAKKSGLAPARADNLIIDPRFISEVAPRGGISFAHERYVHAGDGYEATVTVYRWPRNVSDGWLETLFNIDDAITVLDIMPKDASEIKKNISKSMDEQASRYISAKKNADRVEAQARYNELETLLSELSEMDKTLKAMSVKIYVYAHSVSALDDKVMQITETLEGDGYKGTINLSEGKFDWQCMIIPYAEQMNSIYKRQGQYLTSITLAVGNPYNYVSLSDPFGAYYGRAFNGGGTVNLDIYAKTTQRLSYSAIIAGALSSGKSTLLKKMIIDRTARGDFMRVLDPSKEFIMLADYLGGSIISLDGDSGNIINALQILSSDENMATSFSQHMSKVSSIYRYLHPGAELEEVLMMERVLRKLYEQKGFIAGDKVAPDAAMRDPKDYPIFSDLLDMVKMEIKATENLASSYDHDLLKSIELVLDNLCNTYGTMFNGHTRLRNISKEKLVVFDTYNIKNLSAPIYDALIFSAISLCWDNCIAGVGSEMKNLFDAKKIALEDVQHFQILIDEAHEVVSADKLAGVELLDKFLREARKYFGGLSFASQSISDFVPEGASNAGVMKIKNLFELAQYKWILRQDSSRIKLLKGIFDGQFTEAELASIPMFETGDALLSISGDRNIMMHIDVPDEEMKYFSGGA